MKTNRFNISFDQTIETNFKQLSNCSINDFITSIEYDFQDCLKPRLILTYTNAIINETSVYKILKQILKPNKTDVSLTINLMNRSSDILETYTFESQKIFLIPFDKLDCSESSVVYGKMFIYTF